MKKTLKYLGFALLALVIGYLALNFRADKSVIELMPQFANGESEFMDLDHMRVHYRDEGDATDSIPVVLIHGTSASLHTWDGWTAALKASHRMIRLDMPGYGLTGPNEQGDYSMHYYAEFLHRFLQRLGIKKCYVAGNSLGGAIAWHYAHNYPEGVEKLILIDAAGYRSKGKLGGGALGFKIAQMPVLSTLMKYITPKGIVKKSLLDAYGNDDLVSDTLVNRYFAMLLREGNRAALQQRFTTPLPPDDSALIKQIKCPTLIMWGDLDQLIPVEHAQRFSEDLPNDTLVIYKGLGHVPMEEQAQLTAKAVAVFLGR